MKTDEAQKKVAMPPCTVTSATEIETDIKPPPDLEHMLPTPQPTICKMENSEIIQKIPKNRVKTPPTSSKKKLIKNKVRRFFYFVLLYVYYAYLKTIRGWQEVKQDLIGTSTINILSHMI